MTGSAELARRSPTQRPGDTVTNERVDRAERRPLARDFARIKPQAVANTALALCSALVLRLTRAVPVAAV